MNMKIAATIALAMTFFASNYSHADSTIPSAHVKVLATSQLFAQGAVIFSIDVGNSDCPKGAWIYWYNGNTDQLKVWYASILAAYVSQTPIWVHFPTVGSCVTDSVALAQP